MTHRRFIFLMLFSFLPFNAHASFSFFNFKEKSAEEKIEIKRKKDQKAWEERVRPIYDAITNTNYYRVAELLSTGEFDVNSNLGYGTPLDHTYRMANQYESNNSRLKSLIEIIALLLSYDAKATEYVVLSPQITERIEMFERIKEMTRLSNLQINPEEMIEIEQDSSIDSDELSKEEGKEEEESEEEGKEEEEKKEEKLEPVVSKNGESSSSSSNNDSCVICLERQKSHILMPCAHYGLCGACAIRVKECPTCREKIKKRVQIYNM